MRLQGQYVDVRLAGAAAAFVNDNPLRAGLVLPNMEDERLFVRPSSASTNVGTVEDDSTSAKGLSVSSVSVWGTTHKVRATPGRPQPGRLTSLNRESRT